MSVQFPQLIQKLAPGYPLLDLFTIDCTLIGGTIYYFTPGPLTQSGSGGVVMADTTYLTLPIDIEGLEWNGRGPLPSPKMRISNVLGPTGGTNYAMALVIANNDLLGATVTYVQTFTCFLDGQVYADPTATSEPAIFRVDRKSHADKNFVELELAAVTDQEGKQLPFRQVLQGVCTRSYRVWDVGTGSFIQQNCPYTGSDYFTAFTVSTENPALDQCGRRLRDCVARFGVSTPLPTRAFPGVALNPGG
jgi:lambda family phage minor tail protein L